MKGRLTLGTKNNPGAYDCYANAEPDEPMFVLLGRDTDAPALVRLWALMRKLKGEEQAKVDEAVDCAKAMTLVALSKGKPKIDFALLMEAADMLHETLCQEVLFQEFPMVSRCPAADALLKEQNPSIDHLRAAILELRRQCLLK